MASPVSSADCPSASGIVVDWREAPSFEDDLDFKDLPEAIDRSLTFLSRLPADRRFTLCGIEYPMRRLVESLNFIKKLAETAPDQDSFTASLRRRFVLCRAAGSTGNGQMLLTGYFEPRVRASLEKSEGYRYPLYRRPADLIEERAENGERQIGRIDEGRLLPYWSRAEIETGGLLAGQELAWLADPLDAFTLQVQGSGRLVLPDGSERRVQFAGKNGLPYRSVGKVMAERGIIPLEAVTMPRIIRYLREHPEEQAGILHQNPSFVFFRWGDNEADGPLGSLGEPLVAGRSIALDQTCFPAGALGYLASRMPRVDRQGTIIGGEPLGRFVLNQDSGSAIRGPGRADLFLGAGEYAETAAGVMKQVAALYFFVHKSEAGEGRNEAAGD